MLAAGQLSQGSYNVIFIIDGTTVDTKNLNVNPGPSEICNGIDDDRDGLIDEGSPTNTYYFDNDGDNYIGRP
ncbi:MAG: hypothetical protein R2825_10310 [Saprospiraceae bacterium]